MNTSTLTNNAPTPFQFQSHAIRVLTDDQGNPWFLANDVCQVLGYKNTSKAISDHCREGGVTKRYIGVTTGTTKEGDEATQQVEALFIDEGNLYRLTIKSRKPEAEPFEIWVCDDVLPSIRKTGQYTQPAVTNPTAPRAKFALPGGVSLESQDLLNDMIADILARLPKEKQGSIATSIRSAILTKYDLKGVKHGYKNIPDEQFTNIVNFIARLPIEADQYLTYTKEELDLLIKSEVTKALPLSAKEGELMPASNLSITLNLPPLVDNRAKRFLITQQRDEMLTLWPLNDNQMVMTFDQAVRELNSSGEYLAMKKESVSIAKMVMDYIPAQHLPVLIETAGRRLKAIQS